VILLAAVLTINDVSADGDYGGIEHEEKAGYSGLGRYEEKKHLYRFAEGQPKLCAVECAVIVIAKISGYIEPERRHQKSEHKKGIYKPFAFQFICQNA
jgi:hypothetical protein